MEKWLVVGYRTVSFKDKNTGKDVKGYSLFLLRDPDPDLDKNIQGQITEKIFISSDYVPYCPAINDEVELCYNKYGKVSSIEVI